MRTTILFVGAGLAMAGCAGSDTEIIGSLEPRSEATLIIASDARGPYMPGTGIGLQNDRLLVSSVVVNDVPFDFAAMTFDLHTRWFALDGTALSDDENMGVTVGYRNQWVRAAAGLSSAHYGDPEARVPQVWDRDRVWFLDAQFGQTTEARRVDIGLADQRTFQSPVIHLPVAPNDGMGTVPTARRGSAALGMIAASPEAENCTYQQNYQRLIALDGASARGVVASHVDPLCQPDAEVDFLRRAEVGDPWLMDLGDGELGLLFRWNAAGLALCYARLDPETLQPSTPVAIGNPPFLGLTRGGYQPRGAAAPGGRVIAIERHVPGRPWDEGRMCQRIVVLDADGSNAHDAPWQLPCHRTTPGNLVTPYVEAVAVPTGVVLVWSERTGPVDLAGARMSSQRSTAVLAVLLTRDGRRGSSVLELVRHDAADPADTFFDLMPVVAADGASVVAGWLDPTLTPPGLYVRGFDVTSPAP